jgi:2'-5' RNA ligase
VIWVGVEAGAGELASYAARFDSLIGRLGYAPDPRGFTPHITLARNPGERMEPGWERELGPLGADFSFTECVLFQSVLSPRGSTYVRLRQAAFA